MNSVLWSVVF